MILLLAPLPAWAQKTDEQLWLTASASTHVGDDVKITVESIGRFSDNAGGFFHAEIGGLASFTVAKNIEVAAGYRHVEDWDHGIAKPNEERLRQQVTLTLGGGFAVRLRTEQRFQSTGGEVGFRVRPQVRFTLPVGGGVSLFATQEHFINLNTTGWGQRGGYERMRNTVGVTLPLAPHLKTEIGYLNQYRFGRGGARDQMDHALTLTLNFNFAALGHGG
jgi:hypothetical protein